MRIGRGSSWEVLLVLVALSSVLLSWMLVNPVGGYPDDSFHFANTWCDEGIGGFRCEALEGGVTRLVPNVFTDGSPWWEVTGLGTNLSQPTEVYPRLFYAVMRPFAGESVVSSVVVMRLFNVSLTVVMFTLALVTLRPARRFGFVATWLVVAPGLGFFYLASNHPLAWLYLGAGTGWAFTIAAIESDGGRRRVLAAFGLVLAIALMLGSRPEGQVAALLAVLVGVGLSDWSRFHSAMSAVRNLGSGARRGLIVGGVVVSGAVLWLFGRSAINRAMIDAFNEARAGGLLSRLVDVPYLYLLVVGANTSPTEVGVFGAQSALLVAAAVGVVVLGRRDTDLPRGLVAISMAGVALIAPLVWGNTELGVARTPPRYLFTLLLLTVATAMAAAKRPLVSTRRAGWGLPGSALVVGHSLALHGALRSYRVGEPPEWTLGLNGGLKWWWQWGPSPQSVWLVGSAAFAALVLWGIGWPERDSIVAKS